MILPGEGSNGAVALEEQMTEHVVPTHVAIIMDGNNRWAKRQGLPGTAGHRAGVEAVRGVLRSCRDHGVKILTLFAFSSENWNRPADEVSSLFFTNLIESVARRIIHYGSIFRPNL